MSDQGLPTSIHSSILGENPFPPDDVRHQRWIDLGLLLKEAELRLKAEYLGRFAKASPEQAFTITLDFVEAYFDLFARSIWWAVSDYESAAEIQSALSEVTKMLVKFYRTQLTQTAWPPYEKKRELLTRLQLRLNQREMHWTAEAMRRAREGSESQKALTASAAPANPAADAISNTVSEQRTPTFAASFPRRAGWLRSQLDSRSWSVHDLQSFNGPNWRTSKKVLGGLAVRETALERMARGLSARGQRVTRADIPND